MSSRNNFLDADNSMMERNLRFVKNDLEDNLNQYFGGAGGITGNSTATAPPRDYKVVQPKPGGSHASKPDHDLEERNHFLKQLGLPRHLAYNLAKSTCFEVSYFTRIRNNWLENGVKEKEVQNRIVCEIQRDAKGVEVEDNFRCTQSRSRSTSRSTPRDFNSIRQEYNYIAGNDNGVMQYDRSLKRSTEQIQYRYQERPNERVKSASYEISSKHRDQACPNDECFQKDIGISTRGYSNMTQVGNGREDLKNRTPSPPSGLFYMQQEKGRSRGLDHLRYSRPSRSPSPPSHCMQQERGRSRGLDHFRNSRPSRSPSPPSPPSHYMQQERGRSRGLDHFRYSRPSKSPSPPSHCMQQERGRSRGLDHFRYSRPSRSPSPPSPPSHFMQQERGLDHFRYSRPSRSRSPPRGFNSMRPEKSSPSFQKIQLGFGNQFTKSNVNDYRSLFQRRRDINDQDLGNPMHMEGNTTYTTSLKDCNKSASYNKSSLDFLLDAGYATSTPPLEINRNTPSNNNQVQAYGRISNIQPAKDYQNSPSPDNQLQDYGSNSNKPKNIIPSLLSLPLIQLPVSDRPQPSKMSKARQRLREHRESLKLLKMQKQQEKIRAERIRRLLDPYKIPISSVTPIPCGLLKPPPGLSKAKPQEYWSQWWPRYKYLEKSLENIISSLKPDDIILHPHNSLLYSGTINILRNCEVTESNYYLRDNYKFFKYKKQLEQPSFQKSLEIFALKKVQEALAKLQNKSTMALLHQSLIDRCDFSIVTVKRAKAGELIKSAKAFNRLGDKIFLYLVMESIQQLKEICKAEWPQFEEFYNSIDTANDEIDIYKLISSRSGNHSMSNEQDEEDDNEDDEQ